MFKAILRQDFTFNVNNISAACICWIGNTSDLKWRLEISQRLSFGEDHEGDQEGNSLFPFGCCIRLVLCISAVLCWCMRLAIRMSRGSCSECTSMHTKLQHVNANKLVSDVHLLCIKLMLTSGNIVQFHARDYMYGLL